MGNTSYKINVELKPTQHDTEWQYFFIQNCFFIDCEIKIPKNCKNQLHMVVLKARKDLVDQIDNKKAIRISIAYRPLETCIVGGGGSSTNFTWGESFCPSVHRGGGLGGTHHALQLDVINVLTCGQKEEMKVCTCLYSCVALHHGILPPPPCEQKDRNSENITFAILRMRAVKTLHFKCLWIELIWQQ